VVRCLALLPKMPQLELLRQPAQPRRSAMPTSQWRPKRSLARRASSRRLSRRRTSRRRFSESRRCERLQRANRLRPAPKLSISDPPRLLRQPGSGVVETPMQTPHPPHAAPPTVAVPPRPVLMRTSTPNDLKRHSNVTIRLILLFKSPRSLAYAGGSSRGRRGLIVGLKKAPRHGSGFGRNEGFLYL